MAISAQRFNFLDQETNVPVADFTKVADNFIYNSLNAIGGNASSLLNSLNNTNILSNNNVNSILNNLSGLLASGSISGTNGLDTVVNQLVNNLQYNGSPNSLVNDLMSVLQPLAGPALNAYLTTSLRDTLTNQFAILGTAACKSNGYNFSSLNLDQSSLSSLILRFAQQFLSRYCPAYSYNSSSLSSLISSSMNSGYSLSSYNNSPMGNNSIYSSSNANYNSNPLTLNNQFSSPLNYTKITGVKVTQDDAFDTFLSYYRDYLKKDYYSKYSPPYSENFDAIGLLNDIKYGRKTVSDATTLITTKGFESIDSRGSFIRSLEITARGEPYLKDWDQLDTVSSQLKTAAQNAPIKEDTFSKTLQQLTYAYTNLASVIANIVKQNISVNNFRFGSGTIEEAIYESIFIPTINNARNSSQLLTYDFSNLNTNLPFKLSSILAPIKAYNDYSTTDIYNYIFNYKSGQSNAHRLYGNDPNITYNAIPSSSLDYTNTLISTDNSLTSQTLPSTYTIEATNPSSVLDSTLSADKALYAISSIVNPLTPSALVS